MAARLSSFIVLLSIGICAGEDSEGFGGLLVAGPRPGPSSQRPHPTLSAGLWGVGGPVAPGGRGSLPGEVFAEEPVDVVVRKGADAVLVCRPAAAYSSWAVKWRKDGLPLTLDDTGSRRFVDRAGNLIIRQVFRGEPGERDEGEYRCALSSSQGMIVSRSAQLLPPSLSHPVQDPVDVTVSAGETARFSCIVDSVPAARITWKKDGKTLPLNTRYVILPSGVLLISQVESSDGGKYKCVAFNDVLNRTRNSNASELKIYNPQDRVQTKFLSKPDVIDYVEGGNVSFECSVSGNNFPVWSFKRNGNLLNNFVSNLTLPGISILTIHNITEGDSGIYNCSYSTSSKVLLQSFELRVMVPPTVTEPPKSQTLPTAHNCRFKCNISGSPPPALTWFKDGVPLTYGRIKLTEKNDLLVSDSRESDTGIYQCMVKNKAGENWGFARQQFNSFGLAPPTNIACHDRGDDFITLKWSSPLKSVIFTVQYWISGDPIHIATTLTNSTNVTINGLEMYTNYTFSVRYYAEGKASEPGHELTCLTGPAPPVAPGIHLTVLSPSTLLVTWTPLDNGEIIGYKIQWRQAQQTTAKIKEVLRNVSNFTIRDLIPGGTYRVRVLGRTDWGYPASDVEKNLKWEFVLMPPEEHHPTHLNLSTSTPLPRHSSNAEFPIDPPGSLEAEATSPTSINLTWSAPSHVNVMYYSIVLKEVQSSQSRGAVMPKVLNCTNLWVEIDHLVPNTIYEFMLMAHDVNGHSSSYSEKIECRTFSEVPEIVSVVSWMELNATSIKVEWEKPSSPVSQFNVSLIPLALEKSHPFFTLVNGSSTNTVIHGINSSAPYQLTVRAVNRDGTGPPSEGVIVLIQSPTVVQSPMGEQYSVQSPDVPLMLGVVLSITAAVVFAAVLVCLNTCRTYQRGNLTDRQPPQSLNQPNGNCVHGQMTLTSFVTSDSRPFRSTIGRQIDLETHHESDVKDTEESNVTLLPPGNTPTPIGAHCVHQNDEMKKPDRQEASPCWGERPVTTHKFHITENPQFDSPLTGKSPSAKYSHDPEDEENSEEVVKLLSTKSDNYCESEEEYCCGDVDTEAVNESLNNTQITDIDHSFHDTSNSNAKVHDITVSSSTSHSNTSEECHSRRSSSFIEDSNEDSSTLTKQQLLVTFSSVPLHHLTSKPFMAIPKVSVVGQNG